MRTGSVAKVPAADSFLAVAVVENGFQVPGGRIAIGVQWWGAIAIAGVAAIEPAVRTRGVPLNGCSSPAGAALAAAF